MEDGIPQSGDLEDGASFTPVLSLAEDQKCIHILLREGEKALVSVETEKKLEAPLREGEVVGRVIYSLDGQKIKEIPLSVPESIEKIDMAWCLEKVRKMVFFSE